MSEDRKPKGPYILWLYYGLEGWSPHDYPTFNAAIDAVGGWSASTWVITMAPLKPVEPESPT